MQITGAKIKKEKKKKKKDVLSSKPNEKFSLIFTDLLRLIFSLKIQEH